MSIVSLNNITKYYADVLILKDISFAINMGDKLGLIGKNGAGKTTLLKILMGIENSDSGEMYFMPNMSVSYMEQSFSVPDDTTLLSFCFASFSDLLKQEAKLEKLEERMNHFDKLGDGFNALLAEYDRECAIFENNGGYLFRSKVKKILTGLGFDESEHLRKVSELSGGQLNRLNLSRLIASEPDLLLLDEPTNHLDIQSIAWLEGYMRQYPKSAIIVSHDRYFLDSVTNKTLEIENFKGYMYDGNYSVFKAKKAEVDRANALAYDRQQKEIRRQEDLIRLYKQRGTELLAKRAKSREKMLEKIDLIEKPEHENTDIKIRLNMSRESGNDVAFISGISKAYDDFQVLDAIDAKVFKGQKIGLIGDNGSGKSTLLRILSGDLKADAGDIKFGSNVDMSYYDQKLESLDDENTVLDEIVKSFPKLNDEEARIFLGRLLFSNDDVFKKIKLLSGGEKARVTLAKLMLTKANFLILDEPTNHLDIYSKEILENALKDFDGTILSVSHDRYFLNNVATVIWELDGGKITEYVGNYDEYLSEKARIEAFQASLLAKNMIISTGNSQVGKLNNQSDSSFNSASQSKMMRIFERQAKKEAERNEKKRERRIAELENLIHEQESEIEALDAKLCEPEVYQNYELALEIENKKAEIKNLLDDMYNEFFELNEDI